MKKDLFEGVVMLTSMALVVSLFFFMSCKSQHVVTEKEEHHIKTEQTDSSIHETKDSVIGVSADSAFMQLKVACDSMGNAYIKDINRLSGERTELSLRVDDLIRQLSDRNNGKGNKDLVLDIDCAADSLSLIIEKQTEIIKSYQSKVDSLSHIENHTEYVNVVPSYYKNCTRGFWWLLVIDLLVVALVVLYFVGKNTPWGKGVVGALKLFFNVIR